MPEYYSLTSSFPKGLSVYPAFVPNEGASDLGLDSSAKSDFIGLTDQAAALMDSVLPALTTFYNSELGVNASSRQVEFLLYRSLSVLIRQFLGSFYLLERVRNIGDGPRVFAALDHRDFVVPNSEGHLMDCLKNDDLFSLQIFSLIMKAQGYRGRHFRRDDFQYVTNQSSCELLKNEVFAQLGYAYTSFKEILFGKQVAAWRSNILTGYIKGSLHGEIWDKSIVPLPVPRYFGIFLFRRRDKLRDKLRKVLLQNGGQQPFFGAFIEVLCHCLPKTFIEGASYSIKRAKKSLTETVSTPPILVLADRFYYVHERFFLSELIAHGTKLGIVQHGSVYGESSMAIFERSEVRVSDYFLTWGWTRGNGERPFYAVKFGLRRKALLSSKQTLLWLTRGSIGNLGMEHLLYFDYFEVQERFYENLHPDIQARVVLRMLVNKYTDPQSISKWRFRYSGLTADYMEQRLERRLAEAKLVVIDYFFSTGFAECIVLDIPVVVFEENRTPSLTPLAERIYSKLSEVGIVHYSRQSAVDFVNQNFGCIENWWRSAPVREALTQYIDIFARPFSQDALLEVNIQEMTGNVNGEEIC